MTTLYQAQQAIADNHNYINPQVDPKTHNINVGLAGIIQSLMKIERRLDEIERKIAQIG